MTIINEERNSKGLNESIRMMKSQRSDAGKIILIEESKKICIDEIIKRNENINTVQSRKWILFLKCKT